MSTIDYNAPDDSYMDNEDYLVNRHQFMEDDYMGNKKNALPYQDDDGTKHNQKDEGMTLRDMENELCHYTQAYKFGTTADDEFF